MRILLINHSPLEGNTAGHVTRLLAAALIAAGHEVRAIIVDTKLRGDDPCPVRRVLAVTDTSPLGLPPPLFTAGEVSPLTYVDLTGEQVARYRELLRQALDIEVHRFDPHLIHAMHAWLWAELALESGVPYVATVLGEELDCYEAQPRYRYLADQAVENAGRLFVPSCEVAERIERQFDVLPGSLVSANLPVDRTEADELVAELLPHYREVVRQRLGSIPD